MAGDIGVRERAVVIGTEGVDAGLRVLHRYGSIAIVEAEPTDAQDEDAAGLEAAAGADPVAALGLAAFRLRQSPEYIAANEQNPYEGMAWDAIPDPSMRPDPPPDVRARLDQRRATEVEGLDAEAQALLRRTSLRMTGTIAVGVIIVSGPSDATGGSLQFSQSEQTNIQAQIQGGVGWLTKQSTAANIQWSYDLRSVQLNLQQPGDTVPSTEWEQYWRDPAMAALGYAAGVQGMLAYLTDLLTTSNADWAYIAYFTKYKAENPGYAYLGGPNLVMAFRGDMSQRLFAAVFAHETGHIFQATDEYAASGCDCGGAWGYFGAPNGNCATCAPGGGVPCIMRHHTLNVCKYTPWHFGFPWPAGPSSTIDTAGAIYGTPSPVVFNGNLTVLFLSMGTERPLQPHRIMVTSSKDGLQWTAAAAIGDQTTMSPTACVFNDGRENLLYAFWRTDSAKSIYYSVSRDGVTWSQGTGINNVDSTPQSVAACVFTPAGTTQPKLYLFWTSNDGLGNIISSSAAEYGQNWPTGKLIVKGATLRAPAACVFRGKLYLFWLPNKQSSPIRYSVSSDGVNWTPPAPINDSCNPLSPPSALVFGRRLFVFWRDNSLYNSMSASSDGVSWPPGSPINIVDKVVGGPTSVVFPTPYVFWPAGNASQGVTIRYSS